MARVLCPSAVQNADKRSLSNKGDPRHDPMDYDSGSAAYTPTPKFPVPSRPPTRSLRPTSLSRLLNSFPGETSADAKYADAVKAYRDAGPAR